MAVARKFEINFPMSVSDSSDDPPSPLKDKDAFTWTLWYLNKKINLPWKKRLMKLTSFDSLDDFLELNNVYRPCSELVINTDFMMFKSGITPSWDDPKNVEGGRWIFEIPCGPGFNGIDLGITNLLREVIQNGFSHPTAVDIINGASISRREGKMRMALWTSHPGVNTETLIAIGYKLKSFIGNRHQLFYLYNKECRRRPPGFRHSHNTYDYYL